MKSEQLIDSANRIIHNYLENHIISSDKDPETGRLKIVMEGGLILYIRYNNYREYSYVVIFSMKKYDRIRFDNYDHEWDVKTKPHHCHLRLSKEVSESQMVGNPDKDMKTLSELISSGKIYYTK